MTSIRQLSRKQVLFPCGVPPITMKKRPRPLVRFWRFFRKTACTIHSKSGILAFLISENARILFYIWLCKVGPAVHFSLHLGHGFAVRYIGQAKNGCVDFPEEQGSRRFADGSFRGIKHLREKTGRKHAGVRAQVFIPRSAVCFTAM